MELPQELLNQLEMQNEVFNRWRPQNQNYIADWLNMATGTGATSAAAAANAVAPQTSAPQVDSSWVFRDPVGSGKQAQALGMNKASIDAQNAQRLMAQQQYDAQMKQNYLLAFLKMMPQRPMPQFTIPQQVAQSQMAPRGGSIISGNPNDFGFNKLDAQRPMSYNPEDLYATGNDADFHRMREQQFGSDLNRRNKVGAYGKPKPTGNYQKDRQMEYWS